MKYVYLKIDAITGLPKGSYTAWVGTIPIGIAKQGDITSDKMKSTKTWLMEVKPQGADKQSIELVLKHHKFMGGETEAGRLQIPLNWFPQNAVVRDWFPIAPARQDSDAKKKVLAQLSVHCSDRKCDAFSAPPAALLVAPAWDRPGLPATPPLMPQQFQQMPQPMVPQMPQVSQPMMPQMPPQMVPMMPQPQFYPPPQMAPTGYIPQQQPNPYLPEQPNQYLPEQQAYLQGQPIPVISDQPGYGQMPQMAPPYMPPPQFQPAPAPPGSAGQAQPMYQPPPNPYAMDAGGDPVYQPPQMQPTIPQYPQVPPST